LEHFLQSSHVRACRRNEARYQEKLKHSVLAHKVPDEDMERFGKDIDWLDLTDRKPAGMLSIRGISLPFVTMSNEPEYKALDQLTKRYRDALETLMRLYENRREAKCA
jgi:hypothetical protein